MASISKNKNGHRTIQFATADGRRRSIRLGKASQRYAENVKVRVEALNGAIITSQSPDTDTARWVAGLDDVMQDKLARAGLIPNHEHGPGTLEAFLDAYIAGRCDVKPNTLIVWRQTRRCLINYFGADRELRSITPGDADAWRLWLIGQGLAENTVRRRCGFAKQFLRAALKRNSFRRIRSPICRGPRYVAIESETTS